MKGSRRQGTISPVSRNALITFGAFLCFAAVLVLWIVNSNKLTALGLAEQVYYVVLVLLALVVVGFLFGVFRSTAASRARFKVARSSLAERSSERPWSSLGGTISGQRRRPFR
jgi:ABC-type nickel/cobalt efflux system permease component RcnA